VTRSGLLGGMRWEPTSEHYRLINEVVRDRRGGLNPTIARRARWTSPPWSGPILDATRSHEGTEVTMKAWHMPLCAC
jgi:hypothetical protein